jgi:high potential iron-sulfur protein
VNTDQMLHCRRALLRTGTALVASFVVIPILTWSTAAAANKAAKPVLDYQDHPKNGKVCADCWAYIAKPGAAEGSCKAIEGPVSPNGWCKAYSPKRVRPRMDTERSKAVRGNSA